VENTWPNTDQVKSGWRKLQEELHYLHFSPANIRTDKSSRRKWCTGHVDLRKVKKKRLVVEPKLRDHSVE
jgi:hypothetical protein